MKNAVKDHVYKIYNTEIFEMFFSKLKFKISKISNFGNQIFVNLFRNSKTTKFINFEINFFEKFGPKFSNFPTLVKYAKRYNGVFR
jgi:hypothetical protein